MKTKQNKGFTLIELLVVIAIIGILAGIVLVSLGSVRERAEISSLKSTMASATTIANMCEGEGGDVTNYVADAAICSDATIVGNWPSPNRGTMTYAAGGLTITGTAPNGTAITCTISTGSCI